MNLLVIAESYPTTLHGDITGGVEAKDFYLSNALAKHNTVTVLTNKRKNTKPFQIINGVRVIRLGIATNHNQRENPLVRAVFFLSSIINAKKINFDIVQGSNVFSQTITLAISAIYSKPKIAQIPDVFIGQWVQNTNMLVGVIGEILERIIIATPWDKIIALSNSTKEKLLKNGTNKDIITIIPGGVDYRYCSSLKVKKYQKPTITFAGRLVPYKRVLDLIKAAAIVIKKFPNLQVIIIGEGPQKPHLEQITKRLNLSKHITFKGFITDHKHVLKLIKKSHILTLPSIVEGQGLVTLEAMACGVPYVNSAIAPTIEVTQNGRGGLLFPPQNHTELAKNLILLLQDKKLYKLKRHEGLIHSKKFTWEKIAKQTQKTLNQITKTT